jgi:hypothetical protein
MDDACETRAETMADLTVEFEAASNTPTGEGEAAEEASTETRKAARGIEPRGGEAL